MGVESYIQAIHAVSAEAESVYGDKHSVKTILHTDASWQVTAFHSWFDSNGWLCREKWMIDSSEKRFVHYLVRWPDGIPATNPSETHELEVLRSW